MVDILREAGMAPAGESAAVQVILGLLTARLRFFEDRKRHPIADEQIVRPLFATGEPRSGTTLRHALLAQETLDEDEAYAAAGIEREQAPAALARGDVPGVPPEPGVLPSPPAGSEGLPIASSQAPSG